MGTSGAGGGGGGSGGSGGGGGGSGGAGGGGGGGGNGGGNGGGKGRGGGAGGRGAGGRGSSATEARDPIEIVLSRLKPSYLASQFAGAMISGVVLELVALKVDIEINRSWSALCHRLDLKAYASLADVRDAILRRHEGSEPDARIRETVTASVLQYFEELCGYDDDVLYGRGSDETFASIDPRVSRDPLEGLLRCHYRNVLQREEPKLPGAELQRRIIEVSRRLAGNLTSKLSSRYLKKGHLTQGNYLQQAGSDAKETQWLLETVRG